MPCFAKYSASSLYLLLSIPESPDPWVNITVGNGPFPFGIAVEFCHCKMLHLHYGNENHHLSGKVQWKKKKAMGQLLSIS